MIASDSAVFSTGRISCQPAVEAALEEDQHDADRAQGAGQLDVVELDPAGSFAADEHAEAEEEDQPGNPYPVGDHRRGDAR